MKFTILIFSFILLILNVQTRKFSNQGRIKNKTIKGFHPIKGIYLRWSYCSRVCNKIGGNNCGVALQNCCFPGNCNLKLKTNWCNALIKDWELEDYGCQ